MQYFLAKILFLYIVENQFLNKYEGIDCVIKRVCKK